MVVVYERAGHFHGNHFVNIINPNTTITGYKAKTSSVLLVCKIHHKLSVASSLNSNKSLNSPEMYADVDKYTLCVGTQTAGMVGILLQPILI